MTGTPALAAADVSVRFGGVNALSQVSVEFWPSQICGLMGPNGAGKTTLFDVVSGVRRPTGGSVWLAGEEVTTWAPSRRARAGLRRTFQRQQTFGPLTVRENLLAALEWHGGGGGLGADLLRLPSRTRRERERLARVDEVLERCHLTAVADVQAGTLDIGRARMVELGRAVVDVPKALLLDEPTSGLEAPQASELAAVMHELVADNQSAVVLVEHDVEFMMQHCQRIVVLNLGQVLADGTPAEIRQDQLVSAAYLG